MNDNSPSPRRLRTCLTAGLGCVMAMVLGWIVLIVAIRVTFDAYRESSGSMEPTLTKGDVVLTRPAREVKRGDLLVFTFGGEPHVKRVVGLPGEVVQLRKNRLFVNREEIEEPYVIFTEGIPGVRDTEEITVPPNAYFVLGDNRDNALDSRYIGAIERKNVRGRIVFVLSQKNGPWRP